MADTGIPSGPTTKKMLGSASDCVSVNAAITITFQTDKVYRTIVLRAFCPCKEQDVSLRNQESGEDGMWSEHLTSKIMIYSR